MREMILAKRVRARRRRISARAGGPAHARRHRPIQGAVAPGD
jgi:hypothetical protein